MAASNKQLSIDYAYTTLNPVVNSLEDSLYDAISSLSAASLSQQALLQLQVQIQQWSTAISLLTSLSKEIGDTIKGIVQKF